MHIAIWIFVALSLGLWSLMAWGLHALLLQGTGWVGELGALADKLPYGAWVEAWVPGWREMLRFGLDLTERALGWLSGAAPWVVWALWGVGALFTVGGGALLSLVVVLLRPKKAAAPVRLG